MADLNPAIFDLEVTNHELVKLAYDAYLANSRSSHAKTLRRGEVRGGGKKPWKQKGTGRTGEENFTKKLSKNAKRVAVMQALSMKNTAKAIHVIDTLGIKDGKVKEVVKTLNDQKIAPKNVLIVVSEKDPLTLRATNNIAFAKVVRPTFLNVFDVMNADSIVIVKDAISALDNWLIGKENA